MYESVAKLPCGEVTVAKLPCGEVTGNPIKYLVVPCSVFKHFVGGPTKHRKELQGTFKPSKCLKTLQKLQGTFKPSAKQLKTLQGTTRYF